jgi:hypothetical protein
MGEPKRSFGLPRLSRTLCPVEHHRDVAPGTGAPPGLDNVVEPLPYRVSTPEVLDPRSVPVCTDPGLPVTTAVPRDVCMVDGPGDAGAMSEVDGCCPPPMSDVDGWPPPISDVDDCASAAPAIAARIIAAIRQQRIMSSPFSRLSDGT